jgi:murein tripeptide amidase MpaA
MLMPGVLLDRLDFLVTPVLSTDGMGLVSLARLRIPERWF